MSRVLVTGAGGFVGRPAVAALRNEGFEVHAAGRTPAGDVDVDAWHTADLLDPEAAGSLVRHAGASQLLHLAWTTAHGSFWDDPANLDWARATRRLVEAFAEAGGVRAVVAGSCAQYDWGVAGLLQETCTPRRPATRYGQAKQAVSEQLEAWSSDHGLSYATALLFFPYGPFEQPERLVSSVTRSLLAGDDAPVSAGTQVRDFIHVEDCGAALAALVAGETTGAVNVATGRGSAVADVATTIGRIIGREDLVRIGALPNGDDGSQVVADVARLRDEVGFSPRYDLETGLRATIEWWRQRTRRR
ncbi:MAG: NAD(P)-dependent oxidoreductase [Actinomycetota bacterium]|nr:NAD(P)-dependent oxidoreductase [Actinomycetota bacterium]